MNHPKRCDWSKWARATACRTSQARADRRQGRADRCACRRPACPPSRPTLRVAQMGAADGRHRRGDGAHPAQARRLLSGAGAQHEGLSKRRAPPARRKSRSSAPPPRRSPARTSTARSPSRFERFAPIWRWRKNTASRCAAMSPACSAAPTKATWRRRTVAEVADAAATRWAATRSRSATRSASARRPKRSDDRGRARSAYRSKSSPATTTTPTARRSPTSMRLARARHRRVRHLRRRARRLSLRQGRLGQRRAPRTWCTC